MLKALLLRFVEICLLRAGPQDLPASMFLFWASLAGYLLSGYLIVSIIGSVASSINEVVVDAALLMLGLRLVLRFAQHDERFLQTAIASLGTGAVLQLVALPLNQWAVAGNIDDQVAVLPVLLVLSTMIWSVLVFGHILRHALDINFIQGVGASILFLFISLWMVNMVVPDGAA